MDSYTILYFDSVGVVLRADILRAASVADAGAEASSIVRGTPLISGYEIWLDGKVVDRSFPSSFSATPLSAPSLAAHSFPVSSRADTASASRDWRQQG